MRRRRPETGSRASPQPVNGSCGFATDKEQDKTNKGLEMLKVCDGYFNLVKF